MVTLGRITGAILSNWMAVLAGTVITFFLSPFVVHHLGDVAYGVWALIASSVAYLALFDLGLRGAVTHFVAKNHAVGNHEESNVALSAALWIRLGIGGAILLIGGVLAAFANAMFHIPAALRDSAPWVVIFVAAALAISLVTGLFGAVLAALHRFDVLSAITIAQTALTAAGTVILLRLRYSIKALAGLQLAVVVLAGIAFIVAARWFYPQLRIRLQRPARGITSKLWSYSFYVFLIAVSGQLVYYSDNVVAGAMFSPEAVTLFAIAVRLIGYQKQLAVTLSQTMMPLASGYSARGEYDLLRHLLLHGSRAALFVSWPIQVVLFIRGETFIRLWMGPHYAPTSGRILQILLIANVFMVANHVGGNITFGIGKHKPFALWQSAEGVANLVLSIVLAKRMGLWGIAWGTTIPSLVTQCVIWPLYLCQILQLRWSTFIAQVWLRPALSLAPFAAACAYTESAWPSTSLPQFFAQVAAICPLLLLAVLVCFRREIGEQVLRPGSTINSRLLRFGWFARLASAANH